MDIYTVVPGTLVYVVDYIERDAPGNTDLGSVGSRTLYKTRVIVGGAGGDPVQTSFADLTTIIAVSRWGDPGRADNVIPITVSLDFTRSDL